MQRSADRSNKLKYNRMTDEKDLNQAQTPPDDEQSDNSAQQSEDSGDSQAEPGSDKSNEDDQDQE